MEKTAQQVLSHYYGYPSFRENQQKVIDTLLAGQDAFVLMPTGSGKSICYQIPSIMATQRDCLMQSEARQHPKKKSKKPSHAQKEQVIKLLKEGRLDSNQIAEMVGVSPPTVWAFKAHYNMGKYDEEIS
jgi:superfamily II DNA/RNA helicase